MTKYQIEDKQIPGRLFADGAIFTTKEEVRKQLISFHSNDTDEPERIEKMTLEEILDYGEWELVEIKN